MSFVRPGAGLQESRAVTLFLSTEQSAAEISYQLTEGAMSLMRKHGFYPQTDTGNPTTYRLVKADDLKDLARDPAKAKELLDGLKDFENARYAVQTLAQSERQDYWNDRSFQKHLKGGTIPGFARQSDIVAKLIKNTKADSNAGPSRPVKNSVALTFEHD